MAHKPRSQAERDLDLALGQRIAALRRQRGLAQAELGAQIGKIQPLVSAYERGKLRPYPGMIVRFAEALRVSTDELLGVEPAAPPDPHVSRRALRRLQAIDRLPKRDQDALFRTIDGLSASSEAPGNPSGASGAQISAQPRRQEPRASHGAIRHDALRGAEPAPRAARIPPEDPEVRRLWKKFQQLLQLPEEDRRAVIRLVNSLVGARARDTRIAGASQVDAKQAEQR